MAALVSLGVLHDSTVFKPQAARAWLERHARMLAAVIIVLLAAVLLGNGIVLLTR